MRGPMDDGGPLTENQKKKLINDTWTLKQFADLVGGLPSTFSIQTIVNHLGLSSNVLQKKHKCAIYYVFYMQSAILLSR